MSTNHRRWVGALLWALAVVLTLSLAVYQRRSGPTYPLRGELTAQATTAPYKLLRSATTGAPAEITLPALDGVEGSLLWRRYPSREAFEEVPLRHQGEALVGDLPSQPPAGKAEYYLTLSGAGDARIPTDGAVVLRYKGDVPAGVLVPHILFMFTAMLFGVRTLLEALRRGPGQRWMTWTTFGTLAAGGMVLGPLVQRYAFGALWTGVPFGWDLTDNKTLIIFLGWLGAVAMLGRSGPLSKAARNMGVVAAVLMLMMYLIPHSMYGSQLDYDKVDQGVQPEDAIHQG
ncbi:MAG: hypothetical protein JXX28_13530 [Deltaproteobacteria bacterium]|nr:hypothetical protein [Deltaproteobacteria bacterium]